VFAKRPLRLLQAAVEARVLRPFCLALLWRIDLLWVFTDLSSAVWACLWGRSKNEIDDGLAYRRQAWLRRRPVDSFFSPCLNEATVLQESVGDHGHQRVAMKALPGSSLEVIKPEFLFQLLMSLFANLSCFDGGG
jgi:hypothetical protein